MNQKVILAESDRIIPSLVKKPESLKEVKKNVVNQIIEKKQVATRDTTDQVKNQVVKLIAKMLEMNEEDIELNRPFFEYGIDSMSGVEMIDELNQMFNINMSKAIIFDYSSVNDLSNYIHDVI